MVCVFKREEPSLLVASSVEAFVIGQQTRVVKALSLILFLTSIKSWGTSRVPSPETNRFLSLPAYCRSLVDRGSLTFSYFSWFVNFFVYFCCTQTNLRVNIFPQLIAFADESLNSLLCHLSFHFHSQIRRHRAGRGLLRLSVLRSTFSSTHWSF